MKNSQLPEKTLCFLGFRKWHHTAPYLKLDLSSLWSSRPFSLNWSVLSAQPTLIASKDTQDKGFGVWKKQIEEIEMAALLQAQTLRSFLEHNRTAEEPDAGH